MRVRGRLARRVLCVALALALVAPAVACAQSANGPLPSSTPPTPPASLPDGWIFVPGLGIGLGHDSNVFATPAAPEGDVYLETNPSLRMRRVGAWGDATVDASLTDTRYRDHDAEDSLDYRIDASGNLGLSATSKLFGGLGFGRDHEDRTSPDDVFGIEPTRFEERNAHVGFAHRGAQWMVRLGGTYRALRFENVLDAQGIRINNQDRNRDVSGFGVRVGYALLPRADLFVQGTLDGRRYQWRIDDDGFERGSTGATWALGLSSHGAGKVQGEVYAGWLSQRYDDPVFEDVGVPTLGGTLRWQVTPATLVSASLERAIYDTTIPGASGYLDTSLALRVNRRVNERLSARAGITLARSDFNGIDRTDDIANPSIGLSYRLSRRLQVDADYRLLQRRSDEAGAEYDRNMFYVGLRLDGAGSPLLPASDGADPSAAASGPFATSTGPSGFYVGTSLGYDVLGTRVTGARGEHGDYLADFSGAGGTGALFAGYGRSFGRFYLAAEFDATSSRADWRHDKSPDSRIFATGGGRETGLTLLAGLVLPEHALATLGIGRRRADFDSSYVTDEGLASEHGDRTSANSFGLGLEVPVSAHAFARARYEVAPYAGYDVTYDAPQSDRFSGSQGRFQLGIGWRFGPSLPLAGDARRPGGFYAGAQGGDDRVHSALQAVMRQGNAPTLTDFEADFGGRGLDFGAFAGYGRAWGPFYAGVELEADSSKASWHHDRLPEGRQFSIESRSSAGVALRMGYATRGGALLYARAGRVRGRFNVRYEKGENPDAWVDRDDTLPGTRIGVGLETPLSSDLFLRMDYSRTAYDSIAFSTTHAKPDDISFNNQQYLARIGLGIRF